jgi:polyhydroxyalkanoate synthesis regulator phasin
MATKARSTRGTKKKPATRKKAASKKRKTSRASAVAAPIQNVEALKKTIAYFYALSYCPPEQLADFRNVTKPLRKSLAESAGMSMTAYFKAVLPEVCRRIVSYHEATREPSREWVEKLIESAVQADKNAENVSLFQDDMSQVARLPQRASPENRLHRKKGCQYCRLPCYYGYFTLISEPVFRELQQQLEAEAQKPAGEQSPAQPVWEFTIAHLEKIVPSPKNFIHRAHIGNLGYCLLMLSMAKSRLAVPEAQLQAFQEANQKNILTP